MQRLYSTRPYSIKDFEEWNDKGELELSPKFQRRSVWRPKARSYLIDSIIRGKPVPKIYMRLSINPKTRRTRREVVDGQQRLRTVLDFLQDGFKIRKTHNEEYGGKTFSDLNEGVQRAILGYEFDVTLLQDMQDSEVYDVFARLNTYSVTLNPQELRNARFFGEFKTSAYRLSMEFMTFWQENSIFSDQSIARMNEVEFVSELLIAVAVGIREKSRPLIDNFYKDNDDEFPRRNLLEERFCDVMDAIGGVLGDTLPQTRFSQPRLLYPLFCAVYHMQYGLPKMDCDRASFKPADYPKLRVALGRVDDLIERYEEYIQRLEAAAEEQEDEYGTEEPEGRDTEGNGKPTVEEINPLLPEELRFYNAFSEHWVHASNRRFLTEYICGLMVEALRG